MAFVARLVVKDEHGERPVRVYQSDATVALHSDSGWLVTPQTPISHAVSSALWFGPAANGAGLYEARVADGGSAFYGQRIDISRNGYLGAYSGEETGAYLALKAPDGAMLAAAGTVAGVTLQNADGQPVGLGGATGEVLYLQVEGGESVAFELTIEAVGVPSPVAG
ncbi:hypothetical protein [Pseudomonas sp. NPDC007930]|uniref:hypothetical protein n=1 Tax=Pseudomonas sp. NPDC007930 TaxID=3364417 RepID=UPI0036F0F1B0